MTSGVSVYAVGGAGEAGGAGGNIDMSCLDGETPAKEYPDISLPLSISGRDLFTRFVARVNRCSLGMRTLGSGVVRDAVDLRYRLMHVWLALATSGVIAAPLYALGMGIIESVVAALLAFLPMYLFSAIGEENIYSSPLLTQRLARLLETGDAEIEKLTQNFAFCGEFVATIVVNAVLSIPAQFFIVRPLAEQLRDDIVLQLMTYIMYGSMVVQWLLTLSTGYSFSAWKPLVSHFIREVGRVSDYMASEIIEVFDARNLPPKDARERLGMLHVRVSVPLRKALDDLQRWLVLSLFGTLLGIVGAIIICASAIDEHRSSLVISPTAAIVVRSSFAFLIGVVWPMAFIDFLRYIAKPWTAWHRIEVKLRHAGVFGRATDKFGSAANLEIWLQRNKIVVRIFGLTVDDQLPGRLMGIFGSIMGALVLYLLRERT